MRLNILSIGVVLISDVRDVNNPHDVFFKKSLEDLNVAKDFISNYLPAEITGMLDLNSLELAPGSFVDDELRESFTDLLFKANLDQREAYFYFLFEHKSKVHHDISLQLLGYMLSIWKSVANPTSGKLPVIIPLLIYHGRYRWNVGLKLSDLLQQIPNAVQKHVPDYEYILYDLSGFTEDDIKGGVKGRLFLETLASVFKPDFYERVHRVLQLMNELEQKEGVSAYIETVMLYIMNAREDLTVKKFMQIDKEYKTGRGEMIMSLAERLRQEGMQKGMQKGMQEKAIKTAQKMLMKGMDVDEVVELTELPEDEVLKLMVKIKN